MNMEIDSDTEQDDNVEEKEKFIIGEKEKKDFIFWFNENPEDQQILRIFNRKGKFYIYGKHALNIAIEYYKSSSACEIWRQEKESLAAILIGKPMLEKILQDALIYQVKYQVEMYEGSGTIWNLTKFGRPGYLDEFEEYLKKAYENTDLPVYFTVALDMIESHRYIGIAYQSSTERDIGVCEFIDNEEYQNLSTILTQLGVKEFYISKMCDNECMNNELERIKAMSMKCNSIMILTPKIQISKQTLEHQLSSLIKSGNISHHEEILQRPIILKALAGLLKHADILNDSVNCNRYEIILYNLEKYMRLDATALKALNVFPIDKNEKYFYSLYGLLNKCKTYMGKRKLKTWLKQPLRDISEIEERYNVVELLISDGSTRDELQKYLTGLPDIDRHCRKLQLGHITLKELCNFYVFSSRLPRIKDTLKHLNSILIKTKYIDKLDVLLDEEHLQRFEKLLAASLDFDKMPDEYTIASRINDDLQEIEKAKERTEAKIVKTARKIADALGLLFEKTIKLDWYKNGNKNIRCLRVTHTIVNKNKQILEREYRVLDKQRGSIRFTNDELNELAMVLLEQTETYDAEQKELLHQVIRVAQTFLEVFEDSSALISEIDVLNSFAEVSLTAPIPYIRPKMIEEEKIIIKGSRHPLIERQEDVQFIKNDCIMEKENSWFILITGPNMGGKSTYIRQIGVIILMAQIGCFVPCDEAMIAVRDGIFSRIGACDYPTRGISTFMAEMLETASIMRGSSDKSLVIIDELGRGTSTSDGFGLAWAISKKIIEDIKAPTLFATHFHELTTLHKNKVVKNVHVSVLRDDKTNKINMLYKVEDGPSNKSFGIEVAEIAGIPDVIIQDAKLKLKGYEEEYKELFKKVNKEIEEEALLSGKEDKDVNQIYECYEKLRMIANDNSLTDEMLVNQVFELITNLEKESYGNKILEELFKED